MSLTAGTAVGAQTEPAAENTPTSQPVHYGDTELITALQSSDMLTEWFAAAAPFSPEASLLSITGSSSYAQAREVFLSELASFGVRNEHVQTRMSRLDASENDAAALDMVARDLRRTLALDTRSAAVSLTESQVQNARFVLAEIDSRSHWLGFSLDPATMAEHRLASIRDDLIREIDALSRPSAARAKTASAVARLSTIQGDLADIAEIVDLGRERATLALQEIVEDRAGVVEQMPSLHQIRTLQTSEVGGLPLVTVDAYIRGAATLDASCPVDWTLLAGIGRVESRHGTIGESTVQRSGRVTVSIYGPLLDGGATAREAQAARVAEQEEALAAELEAAAAEQLVEEEAFESSVWGQILQAEEEAAQAAAGTAIAPEKDSADDQPPPAPRYDPALWGDYAEADEAEAGDGEDDGDEDLDAEDTDAENGDEPELKGNGFAVIADSDNGRLDGNARWDRAVGPMQFIPETWSYYETDGNGDGVLDPQNLYDAAASAGRFLCRLSQSRGGSPWTFVLGYNSSETYVRNVMAGAEALQIAALPDIESLD